MAAPGGVEFDKVDLVGRGIGDSGFEGGADVFGGFEERKECREEEKFHCGG